MKTLMIAFLSASSFAIASASVVNVGGLSVTKVLSSDSSANISSSSSFDASNVHFNDYKFPFLSDKEYYEKKVLISEWSCLYPGEAFETGYDVQQVNSKSINVNGADNKIIYDYKIKFWKSIPDAMYVKNDKTNHPSLIQAKSKNSTVFLAINHMANFKDGSLGESVYFCLIHNNNAPCGSGNNSSSNKNENLSKDVLTLIESISFDDN
ncbi:hypothetical protein R1Q26_05885 [Klebsiella quasipneumoniae]|uniref:hypothetical protein n=1 Tax=Klebsiella quasipneumoniae TaxID=1463165 RepID=UPI002980B316|nr:hypothetical protein [Klebsiella quasipneumoniae]WPA29248.1 hypothetical protein R1Q26_05885 [Klebsiella quasipneumoniae]